MNTSVCNSLVKIQILRNNTWKLYRIHICLAYILQLRDKLFILWKHFEYCFLKAFLKGSDISSSSFCHLRSKKAFELSWQIFENLDFRLSKSDRCAEIWVVKVASNLLLQFSLCNIANYMKLQVGRMYPIQRYKECIQFDSKIRLNWVQKSVSIV